MLRNKPLNQIAHADLETLKGQLEYQYLDFKEGLGSDFDVCKDLCAFANTTGGDIVVGVKEGEGERKKASLLRLWALPKGSSMRYSSKSQAGLRLASSHPFALRPKS